jgi:hypothetical protein
VFFEESGSSGSSTANTYGYYKWVLPVPLVLNVGETVTPSFLWMTPNGLTSAQLTGPDTIIAHVSLVGQQTDAPGERVQKIPYASAWVPFTANGGQMGNDDTTLVNKFNSPLWIQRLTFRLYAEDTLKNFPFTPLPDFWRAELDKMSNKIRIADTTGVDIVRDMTPLADIFDVNRLAWTFNQQLEPRGRIKVTLNDAPVAATYLPMFGLVGWREEEVG